MVNPKPTYTTLEQIQERKNQLSVDIQRESHHIGELWHELAAPKPASSKGELIASLVSNSITAIDAFLLVRKLMKTYGWIFRKNKSKK
jgi:hypothetical protein